MSRKVYEVNFDGIVGPTHNYSGLSYGNIASEKNRSRVSHPKEAALQGLEKMKRLTDLGVKQAVLPPHERPYVPVLQELGFGNVPNETIREAAAQSMQILTEANSASAMWTANAGTVCPSSDSSDGKLHLTPANLASKFHRSIESETTGSVLRAIFSDPSLFIHHAPLPGGCQFSDEGAANHTRLCYAHGARGIHLFVYGRCGLAKNEDLPKRFPARQTLEASRAIARLHKLEESTIIFARQHPDAIDAGAFHNDVVAVGNERLLFFHEQAFQDKSKVLDELTHKFRRECGDDLIPIEVKKSEVSLEDAVATYLFNSQIVTLPDGSMLLLAPDECREHKGIKSYLEGIASSKKGGIAHIEYVNLRQSMQNGGGPACLRLRIVLNQNEIEAMNGGVLLNDTLYAKLKQWINAHYRDHLEPKDLADPLLYRESCKALDELTELLRLGPVYSFQQHRTAH